MTNAELAVLSLLVEKPRHGYEIQQVIEDRGMRDWTEIGFSSIYYVLAKLEKRGLVSSTQDAGGKGPSRKVYAPTGAGFAACGEASGMHCPLCVLRRIPSFSASPTSWSSPRGRAARADRIP